jgi:hypothetical protein
MNRIVNSPVLIFIFSFTMLWLSAIVGAFFRGRLDEEQREVFGAVEGGALTLLGLLIGFTFSMAVNRYDQRKHYEEAEANTIGTEYLRAGLLPGADAAKVRELLRNYLHQRELFYTTRDVQQVRQIDSNTDQLEKELWSVVEGDAVAQPLPTHTLAVSGMNDVLDSRGWTEAAWRNRIPTAAWVLLFAIAICCNFLIGYGARQTSIGLFMVLPLAVSVSFFLLAELDNPLTGVVRVQPENLSTLSETLSGR